MIKWRIKEKVLSLKRSKAQFQKWKVAREIYVAGERVDEGGMRNSQSRGALNRVFGQ